MRDLALYAAALFGLAVAVTVVLGFIASALLPLLDPLSDIEG